MHRHRKIDILLIIFFISSSSVIFLSKETKSDNLHYSCVCTKSECIAMNDSILVNDQIICNLHFDDGTFPCYYFKENVCGTLSKYKVNVVIKCYIFFLCLAIKIISLILLLLLYITDK